VGFAAETENLLEHARHKLHEKGLDAIVANDVTEQGAGFDGDTNRVTWITRETEEQWPLMSKREVAARLWDRLTPVSA
jgi:phosphopantothenoylcysteine decarboxylase/phosphopantothenate--cysteine ligase